MAFGGTIDKLTRNAIANSPDAAAVTYLPGTGGAIATVGVPGDGGLQARDGADQKQAGRDLVIEVPKYDVPAVIKGKDRITFPGSWARESAATVTWRVAELMGDATAGGAWLCVMRK